MPAHPPTPPTERPGSPVVAGQARATMRRRLLAVAALVLAATAVALAVAVVVTRFPRGLAVAALVALAVPAAWHGLRRRGPGRVAWLALAAALLAGALAFVLVGGPLLVQVAVVAAAALALAAARAAFRIRVDLPPAPRPERAVLFWNPRSGGGKAERFHLPDEARARGIEPVELRPGDDLPTLVHAAVAGGADALAMAGGDGSQAIVAAIAAEHGLPYACIPAGTRNHFALDLGVDRDDVVGALDALVDGGERRVDLAEVNGRVFVNNVSLGLYAEAVQSEGYRDAKLRTLLDTIPAALGPGAEAPRLRWTGPHGTEHPSGVAVLVSNNRYRLGRAIGSGTRPRIDDGLLGITVVGAPRDGRDGGGRARRLQRPWREWSAPEFEVRSERPVPAGIDGEALVLEAPLRFRIRPGVLRVRVAPRHPGASPSAAEPDGFVDVLRALARLAAGRDATPRPG